LADDHLKGTTVSIVDDVASLEERLGYLLKTAYVQLAEQVDAALAPYALTARQLAVLAVVASHEALSQVALSERLGVDRTTVFEMLDELEDSGLVERRRDVHDRRRNILALTSAGRLRVKDAERARAEAESNYLSRLSNHDPRDLMASLRALVSVPDGVRNDKGSRAEQDM
jgi:DNA-binding MarR family transcriptional regulator